MTPDERHALVMRLGVEHQHSSPSGKIGLCTCPVCPDLRAAAAAVEKLTAERDAALAEVARLRAEANREEAAQLQVLEQRDRAEEWADKLAFALGGEAIGEHSTMNNPWQNALDNPTVDAEVARLREAIAAHRADGSKIYYRDLSLWAVLNAEDGGS